MKRTTSFTINFMSVELSTASVEGVCGEDLLPLSTYSESGCLCIPS